MKKAVTVFAALLLALSLVGCGTQKSAATDPKGTGTTVTAPDGAEQKPDTTVPDTHVTETDKPDAQTPETDKPDITDVPEAVGDGLQEIGEDLGLTDDGEPRDTTEDGNVENGPYDSGEYTDNHVTDRADN